MFDFLFRRRREAAARTAELAAANDALRAEVARRQQIEATLRDQREWFRATLASIADAVIVANPDGRITYLNPAAEALTGWPRADAAGRPVEEVFRLVRAAGGGPAESPAGRVRPDRSAVGLTEPVELVSRDGAARPVEVSAAPMRDAAGGLLGSVLVFRDVTDRRRAEAATAEADRRKDEFLAMLSHELRNPLAPILNAVQVMLMADAPDPNVRWARDVIRRQVGHLTRLVDDLLDVSRITSGRIALRREPVDLAAAVERAVETSRPLLDARRHTLTVRLPAEPLRLDGDLTRLAQVFANLLNNAAKYTPDGGRVDLVAAREGGDAVVRVRDSGVGIPPDLLPQVFDLFTQAERSLDRAQGGLGIGLSLVKTLAELHGGRVEAHSAGPGNGSEFVVRLPLRTSEAEGLKDERGPDSSAALHPLSAGKRVLVVDDNVDTALTMARLLRAAGHATEAAYDGPAALAAARRFRPDVVLLDIGLPGMDGYQVARALRAEADGERPLLVALTGYGGDGAKQQAAAAGFDRHLVKPVDPDEVQALVRAAAV
jgi:PAS domain S-box-containing protein